MSTGNPKTFRPAVHPLEPRDVPAITNATLVNGVLTVYGDDTGNNFTIEQNSATVVVREVVSNDTRSFSRALVNQVSVIGGAGNDTFTTSGVAGVAVVMHGGPGADTFNGGDGPDAMFGGQGADRMSGGGGDDFIQGARGRDFILGGDGRDLLYGNAGADTVNGGAGTDAITGGRGNDVLIGIDDGITDTLDAGFGTDVLWYDQNGALTDGLTGLTAEDFTRAVASFINGADKTLDGDEIADPDLPTQTGLGIPATFQYEAFDDRPLFPTAGPTIDDISYSFTVGVPGTQNAILRDAWLLSAVGSMIDTYSTLITTNMVDFGDGTYGVRLDGAYVRVDNDLPVDQFGDLTPAFAQLGANRSVWVAILEKTFATVSPTLFNVTAPPSYSLIANPPAGSAPVLFPVVAFSAFGGGPFVRLSSQFTSATPATSVLNLGNSIIAALNSGNAVTFTPLAAPPVGVPLIIIRAYSVVGYGTDLSGNVTFTLRNPTGVDAAGSTDTDPNDGYVTVTATQLYNFLADGRFDFGNFAGV